MGICREKLKKILYNFGGSVVRGEDSIDQAITAILELEEKQITKLKNALTGYKMPQLIIDKDKEIAKLKMLSDMTTQEIRNKEFNPLNEQEVRKILEKVSDILDIIDTQLSIREKLEPQEKNDLADAIVNYLNGKR